jgi:hypothetical protein
MAYQSPDVLLWNWLLRETNDDHLSRLIFMYVTRRWEPKG